MVAHLLNCGSFFLHFIVRRLLREIFQNNGDDIFANRSSIDGSMKDIIHGQAYKISPPDVSFSMNCDGVPMFKSSNRSLWPIQIIVNEFPPLFRMKNIILAELWLA